MTGIEMFWVVVAVKVCVAAAFAGAAAGANYAEAKQSKTPSEASLEGFNSAVLAMSEAAEAAPAPSMEIVQAPAPSRSVSDLLELAPALRGRTLRVRECASESGRKAVDLKRAQQQAKLTRRQRRKKQVATPEVSAPVESVFDQMA